MDPNVDYLSRYDSPAAVLADDSLTRADKKEILQQWKLDAERRVDSTQEGLDGGKNLQLGPVTEALESLKD